MAQPRVQSQYPAVAPGVRDFIGGRTHKMLIGGQWVEAASGKTLTTCDPATEEVLAAVPAGDKEDIDRAVRAARAAFESGPWRRMTASERGRAIWKLADLVEEHAEEFAQLETLDNGKPLAVSRAADVPLVVDHFRYYAGWATKVEGETIPVSIPGQQMLAYTLREPVGVVGQIIPWNFPLLMAAWKLGVALACGNTVVLKPAEQTPLSALRLGALLDEAGFPPGVVNIVTGYGETAGAALAEHPDVDKVAFTGSTEVGKIIMRAASGNLKRVSLELGGKSPNIVFADADLDSAVVGAANAIFFNHGQTCCAGSRLFIEQKAYDKVVPKLVEYSEKIKLGPGMDLATEMGPLISPEQYERVTGFLDSGKKSEGKALTGGGRPRHLDTGYFVEPTVFADVKPDAKILQEEIFGPVVCAIPFKDVEEVAKAGNDTTYGLAAAVWTRDITKANRLAQALKAGTVWINCYNVFDAAAPFGGYKQSGFGREMGKAALELYTQIKMVWTNLGPHRG
ncbi:MAG: betaine-aldehyde dehydrogenase [Polyangiaceae bacterium UTPRO1]|jgi:phenylacetaldehyde dehydrogenase|nr:aldehyde dehydrogenase family protein [Myxococcales bacterium]OQY65049.1 MAG: betaine-aldehyde dehydrogenase [Polyangiaceae bacterium UTPRO1]